MKKLKKKKLLLGKEEKARILAYLLLL